MSGTHYYLGLDFGTRKIGVAVGQSLTGGAQGLTSITARDGEPNWNQLTELIKTWRPAALVVGIPLAADGTDTTMSHASKRFGERLAHRYNLPVHYVDEHLSSQAAQNELSAAGVTVKRQEQQRDQIAARLILQSFLNSQ